MVLSYLKYEYHLKGFESFKWKTWKRFMKIIYLGRFVIYLLNLARKKIIELRYNAKNTIERL